MTQPFFWPREQWVRAPERWSPNIVTGKGYSTDTSDGQYLWRSVVERRAVSPEHNEGDAARYGTPTLILPRLGQGAFRLSVTDHYERRCAVTGEKTLPILDAAHIRSYAAGGQHVPSNGLLLRTDIHRLFDLGYVTVGSEGHFEVSQRLKEDFDNGRHYYDLHGTRLRPPRAKEALPSSDVLTWHRENRYLG